MGIFSWGRPRPPEVVLALGGGGARGLAHIGVLKALSRHGIVPRAVVGTSMGAIVASLYCRFRDANHLETLTRDHLRGPSFGKLGLPPSQRLARYRLDRAVEHLTKLYLLTTALTRDHLVAEDRIRATLTALLPDMRIEDLPLPFAAVATDLELGEPVLLAAGDLRTACRASASIPGIFPPVHHEGRCLIDGCATSLVPVGEARRFAGDPVVAVDVTQPLVSTRTLRTGIEIWMRSERITAFCLHDLHLAQADFVIRVRDLNYAWSAFNAVDELIRAGEESAERAMPALREVLHRRGRRRLFGRG